jgi:DNA-binding transcriptional MerR regulator
VPLARSRDYLSIGEVLDGLKDDFPDISISKIRFLESEGLIEPERTASGYRKFYPTDVDRLRSILALQRDHFLPLKVIRERLVAGDLTVAAPPTAPPVPASTGAAQKKKVSSSTSGSELTGVQMDREELRRSAGLSAAELDDLEEYGILPAREGPYDEDDLMIATAAKGFFAHGVEARHLRLYKQTTDRELALIEQIIAPAARRKDPQGRVTAGEEATKLAALSRTMREAMLRANVKALF